ncbi:DUF2202 domain-containing protein [Nocardia shimofusensis]|uniref:DUF2202 domain-containing protein n=1 Tax=Nocardia shimofusensis TaxID=228596 RepID=UPI000835002B|nr:DUF2202 domain-containing protein [Nocardia shimofusensis]
MISWRKKTAALAAGATLGVAGVVTAVAVAQDLVPTQQSDEGAAGVLSARELSDLRTMREEERMAHDLYHRFAQQWGARVFERVSASEQRHYEAVGALLARYGIEDPSAGSPAGTYTVPEVQGDYDRWLARGLNSVEEAYAVGAELETADIADLTAATEASDEEAIDSVYGKLRTGSEHHLRAFEAAANGELPSGGHGRGMGQGNGPGQDGGHGEPHKSGRGAHHPA